MAIYAVNYFYDSNADVAGIRPDHRAYCAQLVTEGKLLASGPFVDVAQDSALLIFTGETREDVEKLVQADPMHTGGALANYTITQWNTVMGVFN